MSEELTKLMEEKLGKLYNSIMEKPLKVLDIFNEFFGEPLVDMQGYPSLEAFKTSLIYKTPIRRIIRGHYSKLKMDPFEIVDYQDRSISEIHTSIADRIISNIDGMKNNVVELMFKDIFILVHFPEVRITNEYDRFTDISHLWAKIGVSYDGTMNGVFALNRSEYTKIQMAKDYMHSHVMNIPKYDFSQFQTPCVGTGPISNTMCTLNARYDEDLWNVFCLELSKYVTVESVSGVPYHYLESLNDTSRTPVEIKYLGSKHYPNYVTGLGAGRVKDFMRYFINSGKLEFNYTCGSYSIGMSPVDYLILVSNEFISWYNDAFNKGDIARTFTNLLRYQIIKQCVIDNGKIYYKSDTERTEDYSEYIGKRVCTFKGEEITLNIIDAENKSENISIVLNAELASYILGIILKVLNYRYGKESDTTKNYKPGTKTVYL